MRYILNVLLTVAFATTACTAESELDYDGDFNPHELYEWERVYISDFEGMDLYQCHKPGSSIEDVLVISKKDVFDIILYSYVKEGVEYIYRLDNGHYRQIEP